MYHLVDCKFDKSPYVNSWSCCQRKTSFQRLWWEYQLFFCHVEINIHLDDLTTVEGVWDTSFLNLDRIIFWKRGSWFT